MWRRAAHAVKRENTSPILKAGQNWYLLHNGNEIKQEAQSVHIDCWLHTYDVAWLVALFGHRAKYDNIRRYFRFPRLRVWRWLSSGMQRCTV
jgi:hypothetical protein